MEDRNMKKKIYFILTFALITMLGISGCSKKEEETEPIPEDWRRDVTEESVEADEEPVDESFGGYDADEAYSYEVDTMLPDMDEPVMSVEDIPDYESVFDNTAINRRDVYDYKSKLDYYLILNNEVVFVMGDDFDDVDIPDGWEFVKWDDDYDSLILPGETYYGGITDGAAEVELGFINADYAYADYDECRLKSITVKAYPWMYDEEVVQAEVVGGITFGMTKDEVDEVMTKYGFDYCKWNTPENHIVQYVECLDQVNQFDEVGRYVFDFEDDKLCQISVEYIGSK